AMWCRAAAAASDPLDIPLAGFRVHHVSVETAFLAASRATGLAFAVDPSFKGEVTLELRGGSVRDLIDALAASQGGYWQREGRLVRVRRNLVRFYEIDFPQMTRSAQGSSNVVLSAQTAVSTTVGGATIGGLPSPASGANGFAANPNQNDQTNLSIQQQNQNTFWADVLSELTGLAAPGETVAVNKLAGVAIVSASPERQRDFHALVDLLNRRVSRQVRISARILEVTLSRQNQLGVDWSLAAASAGGFSLRNLAATTAVTAINGQGLAAPTFAGTLSAGKVAAVVSALAQQGDVRSVSNPSILTLSNQTAFIKVGTEQTFFSLSNSTTLNQAGAATPFAATQNSYTQNAITIGTVLYVTPEVNADRSVTVDVLPAVTQLIGVDSSPDGQQTAPRMDIKALSTLARLHPGEAVMIGGLIYNETDRSRQEIPGLGTLPIVGRLFSSSATVHSRSELVIFLTADLVP
ncbi:MAG: type II secretion system protein GspD, partial [Opitutaceae bacterium]